MPRRKKMVQKLEETVNSTVFANEGPTATSSPTKDDSFKDSTLEFLDSYFDTQFRNFERSGMMLMAEIRRRIQVFKLEIGSENENQIVEYWTLEGMTASEKKEKANVPQSQQRLPLMSVPINTGSIDVIEDPNYGSKKKRTRSSSIPPVKNEVAKVENEVFKKPNGRVRASSRKRSQSFDRFKTPASKPYLRRNIATVTPGPDINRPLTIMRRPKPGEMAISLSGSPLLVSTDSTTVTMPSVNVPMDSEKVLSIFPRQGFSCDEVPVIDDETKQHLTVLRDYLNKMCND